ncbi:TrpR YerC/YecD, partial [Candidatus Roizmanbacteria bacterium]|nr:TrpR YerC/YecD [Candidatus Roizmanbacteria bacterium]
MIDPNRLKELTNRKKMFYWQTDRPLTEKEIKEFTNRWKVARMLDKRIPYEEIEKETGMSSTTIARVNRWLTNGKGGYK